MSSLNRNKEIKIGISKFSIGFDFIIVIVILGIAFYSYFGNYNIKVSIFLIIIGSLNLIYYLRKFFDTETKIMINSRGINLEGKFISWDEVEEVNVERLSSDLIHSEYLNIVTKNNDFFDFEITDLKITANKLLKTIEFYRK
ncbi:hypothetical protein NLM59_10105 [Weeksellaceae bacterium KMM 9724]|uniref:hypothetical protein n=1 Tax=Profundicola chukchiensis TaxID=2961959 RepID=UPI00243B0085|nr:hypothetical protein [Profundicola chukchiensis]MDG4951280.1 hypothetical protein [Profundicola chukchiensis]